MIFFFAYFCSKHRLWVKAVLTSTHNLRLGAKVRKICILLYSPILLYESGGHDKGVYITLTCYPDDTAG